jgi:hypothetical protein
MSGDIWRKNACGEKVAESQQVLEWRAVGWAETLLKVLKLRFGPLPQDVVDAVKGTRDLGKLGRWLDTAVTANSLDDFRQAVRLDEHAGTDPTASSGEHP